MSVKKARRAKKLLFDMVQRFDLEKYIRERFFEAEMREMFPIAHNNKKKSP